MKTFPNGHSYVGTWQDGRMHGEGTYFWKDGSEYDGEFRSGVMTGKGKKTWPDGRQYEGAWKQDLMCGEGVMRWPSGECYEGQFLKGAFHGQGSRTKPNGDKYVGDFNNGEQEGKGTFRSAVEGWSFEGLWLHGRMYGEGRVEWPDGTAYVGQWKDGIREGHGKLTWPDGAWYEGPFEGNHVEGHGLKSFPDGSTYEGEFHDAEFNGQGVFRWPDGTEFEGLWKNSEIVGPGCHRFPRGTTITGNFVECGASGEGEKRWSNGCVYNGILKQNGIDEYGTLKWPDGRCYVGHFDEGTLHGEGTLVWYEKDVECTYKGQFAKNVFEGHGVLEWSTGSRYEGSFSKGLYHGDGTFEWPRQQSAYRGQWVYGEMCGKGVLTCTGGSSGFPGCTEVSQYTYTGAFKHGHMEGRGHVVFNHVSGGQDEYRGKFKCSKFNGRGTFMWNDRTTMTGLYENNYCNRVGRKVYTDGREYTGEIRYDLEHGKGIVTEPQKKRIVGIWEDGKVVEELFDSCAPEVDLKLEPCNDSSDEDSSKSKAQIGRSKGFQALLQKATFKSPTFTSVVNANKKLHDKEAGYDSSGRLFGRRASGIGPRIGGLLPIYDETGELVNGRAIINFLNGDKYIGYMREGKKHGQGMYVYADLTMYKGVWKNDVLEGVRHPVTEDQLPVKVKLLVRVSDMEPKPPEPTSPEVEDSPPTSPTQSMSLSIWAGKNATSSGPELQEST